MISVRVDTRQLGRIDGLRGRLEDLSPAMAAIGAAILSEVDLGFREQRDPWGQDWAPLSEATTIPMRRRGGGAGSNKILRDTGVLANSFSAKANRKSAVVGTKDKRAGTHQFGARQGAYGRTRRNGPLPWGDIPARPMLPIRNNRVELPEEMQLEIIDAVEKHIMRGG